MVREIIYKFISSGLRNTLRSKSIVSDINRKKGVENNGWMPYNGKGRCLYGIR